MGRYSWLFVVLATTLVACGKGGSDSTTIAPSTGTGTSTTSPAPATPVPTLPAPVGPVMAPAPAGVPAPVWMIACSPDDNRLYLPDGTINVVLSPDNDDITKKTFASAKDAVVGYIQGKTPYVITEVATGSVIFRVTVNPGIPSDGYTTVFRSSDGHVTGGIIEFSGVSKMHNRRLVMHELFRALGVTQSSPVPGLMSAHLAASEPTPEEVAMFLGRYTYPPLAQCTS